MPLVKVEKVKNLHFFTGESEKIDHICMRRWKGRDVSLSKRIKTGIIIMSGKAYGVQANWRQVCAIMNLLGKNKQTNKNPQRLERKSVVKFY